MVKEDVSKTGTGKGKLAVRKAPIKDLAVKAGSDGKVKGGGGTTGCSLTFKATGRSTC